VIAYVFFLPAFWFFERYLFPWSLAAVLLLAITLQVMLPRRESLRKIGALLPATLLICLAGAIQPQTRDLLTGDYDPELGYRHLGLWARRNLPAGAVVGSSQTGALGYYATGLRVVNLDGVVNDAAFESLVARRNLAYIKREGIEYVLGWGINIRFLENHSRPGATDHLKFLGKIQGIRSWGNDWLLYQVLYE
jgi:hypothetical protein